MENQLPTLKKRSKMEQKFQNLAERIDKIVGSPYWFAFSIFLVLVWLPSGFFFGFNDIWHLMINTTTTILTFLMLSLLHSSQSKWEEKIERLEKREATTMKEIKKDTQKISHEANLGQMHEPEQQNKNDPQS